MPPRKPLSSRASSGSISARRGGRPSGSDVQRSPRRDRTTEQPSPFDDASKEFRDDVPERLKATKDGGDPGDFEDEAQDDFGEEFAADGAEYQTGSDYPAASEEAQMGDDERYGPADGGYTGDEDIYGENDPFPDEDGEIAAPSRGTSELPRADVTRIAPISADEEEGDDEDDANSTRAGPPIHLEVISGPDVGKKRRFRGVRMVIGRAQGCEFKLADNSVSRLHLELVLGDDGVLLRDLGSGNGTRVNGEKVAEKKLEDGDEIAIGQTRFRFVDEAAAFRKRAAQAEAEAEEEAAAEAAAAEAPEEDGAAASDDAGGADAAGDASAPDADDVGAEGGEAAEEEGGAEGPAVELGGKGKRNSLAQQAKTSQMPAISQRRRPDRAGRAALSALSPKQKRIAAVAVTCFALLVLLLIVVSTRPPEPEPVNPNLEKAAARMQEARNALREERYADAIASIESAERLVPGTDQTGLLAGARKELAAQEGFNEVRALLKQGEFEQARAKLAEVPLAVAMNESVRQKVAAEIDAAEAAQTREKVVTALDAQDVATAEELLRKLPPRMALELTPRLEQVREEVAMAQAQETMQQRAAAAQANVRASERRKAFLAETFAAVERKFNAGEFSRATLECDRVIETNGRDPGVRERATNLKKWIPQFGRAFEDGQKKYRAGNLDGAARPLQKARELYRQIGFDGQLGSILDEQLAEASVVAGKAALSRNDLASAGNHFRKALELNPSEARAQQGLSAVNKRGEELYLEAYMIRDRDPREAADKFRIVMDALPKDSETYGKAKAQLAQMGVGQ